MELLYRDRTLATKHDKRYSGHFRPPTNLPCQQVVSLLLCCKKKNSAFSSITPGSPNPSCLKPRIAVAFCLAFQDAEPSRSSDHGPQAHWNRDAHRNMARPGFLVHGKSGEKSMSRTGIAMGSFLPTEKHNDRTFSLTQTEQQD